MAIQQVLESELSSQGIRCAGVPTLEWIGLKYVWLTSYAQVMQASAQKRCQELYASGRAALLIRHNNGDLTVWQGPAGSAQPLTPGEPTMTAAPATTEVQTPETLQIPELVREPEPQPESTPQTQTITIKYRGRTIVKQVRPTDDSQQQKNKRRYRGREY